MSQDFLDELAAVKAQVAAATATGHASMGEFIRHEVSARADSPLAGIVLAAALPLADTPAQRSGRVHLATAMVLLDVALALHKLLLLQKPDADTLDKSLVGGTVLAGDYCFSQAAVAAARTGKPEVVAIFSDLLKELSEAHLRHLFENGQGALDEFPALFQSGGLAGAVLAGLTEQEQQRTAEVTLSLTDLLGAGNRDRVSDAPLIPGRLAPHQLARWHLLLEIVTSYGE